jgi:hypothetical protein
MVRKLTSGLVLAAAVAVGLTVAAAPATAATTETRAATPADEWDRLWHFGNEDLCEAAGNAGEALDLWDDDEWYCDEDGTLYILR